MKQLLFFALSLSLFSSCQKEDQLSFEKYLKGKKNNNDKENDKNGNFKLNINGLEDLGPAARYEGWLIIEGQPVSTGVFSVDSKGKLNKTVFKVPEIALENASLFVLTVEPYPDNNPGPSDVHILGGEFSNGSKSASISVGHPAALGNDYTMAEGKFIIGTPTDGPNSFEESGIWFLSLASGSPAPGLKLPTLPAGWKYEGWVSIEWQACKYWDIFKNRYVR